MSDSRRRSQRSSNSHRASGTSSSSSSTHHRSSRHGRDGAAAPSNRSSTSLHRTSGGGGGGGSGHNASNEHLAPPPTSGGTGGGGVGQIYGNLALRASESRFSLTDQFAATRSVLDFGFDDGASSVFDAQSIFSVGTVRGGGGPAGGGGSRPPSIAPGTLGGGGGGLSALGSPWDAEEGDDYGGGSSSSSRLSDSQDTVLVGYSTVLEEGGGDDAGRLGLADEDDATDVEQTPKNKKTARSVKGEQQQQQQLPPPLPLPVEHLDDLEDPLRLPVPPPARSYAHTRARSQILVPPVPRTHYELLGLSRRPQRRSPPPRPAQIRAAYYRLAQLLNGRFCHGGGVGASGANSSSSTTTDNLMPASLRPVAAAYFAQVQEAFETLVDPARRRAYDAYLDELEAEDEDEEDENEEESDSESEDETQDATRIPRILPAQPDLQTTTDMGVRYTLGGSGWQGRSSRSLAPLDYALTQVVRVGVPPLGRSTERGLQQVQRRLRRAKTLLRERYGVGQGRRAAAGQAAAPWPAIRCGTPVLSLAASTYAVSSAAAGSDVPPLGDRFQPLLPEVLGPARLAQLARTGSTGCVVLGYRQAFWAGRQAAATAAATQPKSSKPGMTQAFPPPPSVVAEVEAEILPRPAVTARAAHAVVVPAALQKLEANLLGSRSVARDDVVHVESMVRLEQPSSLPRVGLGLSRRVGPGSVFLCADSGSPSWWGGNGQAPLWASSTSSLFAPLIAPMAEVGYTAAPHALGLYGGRPLTGPADRGLKGVDAEVDALVADGAGTRTIRPRGTWTVSAAVTGHTPSLAAYARYGRTVFLTPLGRTPPSSDKKKKRSRTKQRAVRVEAELCAADRFAPDGYVAVRALAPVRWWGLRRGWWTSSASAGASGASLPKLGLEVALSAGGSNSSVHVSLYWAHGGRRVKLPFLLLPTGHGSGAAAKLFFWAAALPVAVLAAREFAQVYWKGAARQLKKLLAAGRSSTKGEEAEADAIGGGLDEEEVERAVARHRAEADELTMVLASAVDAQRVLARQLRALATQNGKGEPETNNNNKAGLIILSAKYGVALADDSDDSDGGGKGINTAVTAMASRNGWAPDYEVADVTAAVAALVVSGGASDGVDGDHLLIPRGLRKSRLLGFWDPAPYYRQKQLQRPRASKVLHVRYLWQGQERIAEVGDRDELRLP